MDKDEFLIFLSLDALNTSDFEKLSNHPEVKHIFSKASNVKKASSVFVTNTYTAHTSIVSGCLPYRHGIIDNTLFTLGNPSPNWRWFEIEIRTKTLLKEATKKGFSVAALLWPVTAKSKIKYNLPEIFPNRKGDTQLKTSLRNGTKLFQLKLFLKHKNLLDGQHQPNLDNFTFASLKDVVNSKKANVIFAHFTDADTMKHEFGVDSKEVENSIDRHANRIKELFDLLDKKRMTEKTTVFIFGDHGAFNVHTGVNINNVLYELELFHKSPNGSILDCKGWFKCCGGTAFLRLRNKRNEKLKNKVLEKIEELIKNDECGIKRIISNDEMRTSGFASMYEFGIEAKEGFYFCELDSETNKYKGAHGYSLKNDNYTTSIFAVGKRIQENVQIENGSIMDICPTALKIMDIEPWDMDGVALNKILK